MTHPLPQVVLTCLTQLLTRKRLLLVANTAADTDAPPAACSCLLLYFPSAEAIAGRVKRTFPLIPDTSIGLPPLPMCAE